MVKLGRIPALKWYVSADGRTKPVADFQSIETAHDIGQHGPVLLCAGLKGVVGVGVVLAEVGGDLGKDHIE